MTTTSEWVGLGVAVAAATAFCSYLIYLKATELQHSPRVIWRGLARVWSCLLGAIAVMGVARAVAAGPLIEFEAGQGGLRLSLGTGGKAYVSVVALIAVGILLYLALQTIRYLQQPSASNDSLSHNSPESRS